MIVDINTYTDADYVQSFIYRTSEEVPIDISGKSLHFMVRRHAGDAIAVFEATSAESGHITVTDAAGGAFTLVIPLAHLQTMILGEYVHSLIMVDATTLYRKALWRGTLTHQAGPTRWALGTA